MARSSIPFAMALLTVFAATCAKERRAVVVPLIDELPRARIEAKQDVFVKESTLTVGGDARRSLFMHPTSTVQFDLVVPARAKFSFAVGMPQDVWSKPGDGVQFSVAIGHGAGEQTTVFSRYVNPKAEQADRAWFEDEIDLSLYEGQRIALVLSTAPGPAGDPGWDFAGWANPVVRGISW
jgi:hypothetical protein